jgi:hypothetical protein
MRIRRAMEIRGELALTPRCANNDIAPSVGSSMNSNVKIGLAVAILVVAVFGFTIINRGANTTDEEEETKKKEKESNSEVSTKAVLGFDFDPKLISYDPTSPFAILREHPGYYERGEHQASYWIWNPNPEPLIVTFINTSCARCKYADIGLPAEPALKGSDLPEAALALLGSTTGFSYDQTQYSERKKLEAQIPNAKWVRIEAGLKDMTAEIPAAVSPGRPTWAVVRLNMNVAETKNFQAMLGFRMPSMNSPFPKVFTVDVVKAQPYEVYPPSIDFREVSESTMKVTDTIYYWSPLFPNEGPDGARVSLPKAPSTRGDPHVVFDAPIPMTDAECRELGDRMSANRKNALMPLRVRGGYKYNFSLVRNVPDPAKQGAILQLGLGPTEHTVEMAPQYGTVDVVPKTTIRAVLLGAVSLEEGTQIDLGSFLTRDGIDKTFRLFSDQAGVELEAVPDLCEPKILSLQALSKPEVKNTRTVWTGKVKIEPNQGGGVLDPNATLVFRIKGTGQLVRVKITGTGRS